MVNRYLNGQHRYKILSYDRKLYWKALHATYKITEDYVVIQINDKNVVILKMRNP